MITIKEIIALCKAKQLKDCEFFSDGDGRVPIMVDGYSVPFFSQPSSEEDPICLFELAPAEIERIDEENNYYTKALWQEMRASEI